MSRSVAILLFDDVEVLDACGPFEVFSVANRVAERAGGAAPFEVTLVGIDDRAVVARGGMRIGVDTTVDDPRGYDVVVVPGGVVDAVSVDSRVLQWLKRLRSDAELVASVCTGVFVLAAAGLLDARPVTTHWEDLELLRERWPALTVHEGVRYVDHGDLATSAGISAGLDLALHLVARWAGADHALATAGQMDYDWSGAEHP
ncbi:thiamine biosynthesis protein ThiJ [Rhodococcus sp. 05-340-1]|uniref:DJ-1/PfpI family protein n=1 Tax=unclassified Rhodococcus (in: high G+C Gram-positive bacteria) TaxID=192944 RepID=UPI000B9C2778|nr:MULTISPECIES: DJ-1/PfpI family protein [unclassified Rhodococcus (in: high G+C Gram-positive bacteria)]OZD72496.1 thiamine biosynthesis protein ThiJ [Rhodococcus sp. 05-340-2]OZD76177.1 thiamine biosynthesis protein ThiJ [Rhodococcus sp. 05-340-1]